MLEIENSVAVITGGSGGIGMALAEYWLSKGGKVVIADIVEQALKEAATKLKGDVATMLCDVTREEDCGKLADLAIEKYGQINLVAPFAGIIMDQMMLSTDRETGKVTDLGPIYDSQRDETCIIVHALAVTEDGTIYIGETDNCERSGFLWECKPNL